MPQPTTLAIAAGLAIAGAAIGVVTGRSALSEINPANFKDPDPAFFSDLVPGRPRADWQQAQAQEYQAAAQATSPQGCAGCTWPAVPPAAAPQFAAGYDQPRTPVVPRERAEAPVRIVVVDQPPEPDWSRVERYARYRIDREDDPPAREDGGDGDGGDGGTQ